MGTFRTLLKFRNSDSTNDLNQRIMAVCKPGFICKDSEQIPVNIVPSYNSLSVTIEEFTLITKEGMVIIHEGTTDLDVVNNHTNWIYVNGEYITNGNPITKFIVSQSEISDETYYLLAKIELGNVSLVSLSDIDFSATTITSRLGNAENIDSSSNVSYGNIIRGWVKTLADLPENTTYKHLRSGDVWLVLEKNQFYYWTGSEWLVTGDQNTISDYTNHKNNLNSNQKHLTDNQKAGIDSPASGTSISSSNPVLDKNVFFSGINNSNKIDIRAILEFLGSLGDNKSFLKILGNDKVSFSIDHYLSSGTCGIIICFNCVWNKTSSAATPTFTLSNTSGTNIGFAIDYYNNRLRVYSIFQDNSSEVIFETIITGLPKIFSIPDESDIKVGKLFKISTREEITSTKNTNITYLMYNIQSFNTTSSFLKEVNNKLSFMIKITDETTSDPDLRYPNFIELFADSYSDLGNMKMIGVLDTDGKLKFNEVRVLDSNTGNSYSYNSWFYNIFKHQNMVEDFTDLYTKYPGVWSFIKNNSTDLDWVVNNGIVCNLDYSQPSYVGKTMRAKIVLMTPARLGIEFEYQNCTASITVDEHYILNGTVTMNSETGFIVTDLLNPGEHIIDFNCNTPNEESPRFKIFNFLTIPEFNSTTTLNNGRLITTSKLLPRNDKSRAIKFINKSLGGAGFYDTYNCGSMNLHTDNSIINSSKDDFYYKFDVSRDVSTSPVFLSPENFKNLFLTYDYGNTIDFGFIDLHLASWDSLYNIETIFGIILSNNQAFVVDINNNTKKPKACLVNYTSPDDAWTFVQQSNLRNYTVYDNNCIRLSFILHQNIINWSVSLVSMDARSNYTIPIGSGLNNLGHGSISYTWNNIFPVLAFKSNDSGATGYTSLEVDKFDCHFERIYK